MPRPASRTLIDALGRHPVHPFPARMAPEIVCSIVRKTKRPLKILDPMMGSGTVVALAQSRHHHAVGIDIDPLASLIATVWTKPVSAKRVQAAVTRVMQRAKEKAGNTPASKSFPTNDRETMQFIRYWFDCRARRQLLGLASAIKREKHEAVRNLLWCAFSRLIIAKQGASRALDLVHSRPHRFFQKAPVLPFEKFAAAADQVLANVAKRRSPKTNVRMGDARRTRLPSASIDLVLTSPPYLNAIDYMRCSKFTLVWMGYSIEEIRALRSISVGSEVGLSDDSEVSHYLEELRLAALPKRQRALVAAYVQDMYAAVKEVERVLVPGGRAIYVVGENTVRGVYIRNSKIVRLVAESCKLKFEKSFRRRLPPNKRYLPPPTSGSQSFDSRMRSEIVLQFRKRSQ
ncbi:hypothetical protein QA639_14925 [Bradyrhizobium pachyrhizi]|uniref:hypothetical protein n=1 Tax=Bradyrhizobium pachyrhizi TaxID=280333 RepID=UPI0024B1154B|nr:hypothetical protein [Bradyrhizobium pachyrhizi]WFU58708.1 hypothetical protein QA639_14925 [Bradyrhizobium pachyrhizi]